MRSANALDVTQELVNTLCRTNLPFDDVSFSRSPNENVITFATIRFFDGNLICW